MTLKSPLGRVLGLGSAKDGTGHWWMQRLSSVAMVPLSLWFVFAMLGLGDFSHATLVTFLSGPVNGALMTLLVGVLLYHSHLGVQVVVEDYVHGPGLKVTTLVVLALAHLLLGVLGVLAVLRVAVGGSL
jgi:succinate dehydrogenase / fumarate reductase membrane anchor subunit